MFKSILPNFLNVKIHSRRLVKTKKSQQEQHDCLLIYITLSVCLRNSRFINDKPDYSLIQTLYIILNQLQLDFKIT